MKQITLWWVRGDPNASQARTQPMISGPPIKGSVERGPSSDLNPVHSDPCVATGSADSRPTRLLSSSLPVGDLDRLLSHPRSCSPTVQKEKALSYLVPQRKRGKRRSPHLPMNSYLDGPLDDTLLEDERSCSSADKPPRLSYRVPCTFLSSSADPMVFSATTPETFQLIRCNEVGGGLGLSTFVSRIGKDTELPLGG